jgi:hypothetical protein
VFDLRQSSVPRSGLPRVFVRALACISMQTPGQHVFCRAICSRPGMTAWGALRREGTQHPFADDRLFCLCAQEPPASINRVCSASALQNGIPDEAAGGRGRRRCAVSGYARHAMTSMHNARTREPLSTWARAGATRGGHLIPEAVLLCSSRPAARSVSECQMRHVTIIHEQTCAETTRPDGKQRCICTVSHAGCCCGSRSD